VAACAARGAPPPVVGFARNTATFDVFYWLQVANYGVLYVVFDSAPSGSNHIDVWDLCLHVQMASPNYFVATVLATSPRREQAEKLFDSARDLMRTNRSPLFEVARVLVRLDHIASVIVNANHSIM
jgi:hypothetical protein